LFQSYAHKHDLERFRIRFFTVAAIRYKAASPVYSEKLSLIAEKSTFLSMLLDAEINVDTLRHLLQYACDHQFAFDVFTACKTLSLLASAP